MRAPVIRAFVVVFALFAVNAWSRPSLDDALRDLAKEAATGQGERVQRLSVVSIAPVSGGDNRFGEWLSEALSSEFRKQGRFRLFERSRLDAVAKENALVLSGLVGAEDARKVGELVPVDLLLTGTWTRLGDEVELNLRLLDVVTGEVALALRRKLPLDEAHRALVEPLPPPPAAASSNALPSLARDSLSCAAWSDSVQDRLADLSDEDAVGRLEEALIRVPLDPSPCARGHWRAMELLARRHLPVPRYRAFLLATLDTIKNPSEDRGSGIVAFLAATGEIRDAEWKIVGAAASRANAWGASNLLESVLSPSPASPSKQRERLDGLMELAAKGRFGRPLPVPPEELFRALLPQLIPSDTGASDAEAMWFWNRFAPGLRESYPDMPAYLPRNLRDLTGRLLHRPGDVRRRAALADWLCGRWSSLPADRGLAGEVYDHFRWLDQAGLRDELRRELSGGACAEPVLAGAKANPYRNQVQDLRELALRRGLAMPGFLPTALELADSVRNESWAVFLPASELLAAAGSWAAPALPAALKTLRRTQGLDDANHEVLRAYLAAVVGNTASGDTAAAGLLCDQILSSFGSRSVDSAMAALARLGKTAVPPLERRWPTMDDFVKVRAVRVFARMPAADRPMAWLRARRSEATNAALVREMDLLLDP